jgi:hypothetical protein
VIGSLAGATNACMRWSRIMKFVAHVSSSMNSNVAPTCTRHTAVGQRPFEQLIRNSCVTVNYYCYCYTHISGRGRGHGCGGVWLRLCTIAYD